jgi:hypothetical protein
MSEVRGEPEMTVSFQVAYEGSDDVHAMDVQALAPALLGLGDLIREANTQLNGGRSTINLRVVSDFEHKCFNINFDLVMTVYDTVKHFLQLDDVTTAQNLLHWLDLLGVPTGSVGIGLLGYLKLRRGRPIKNVTSLTAPDHRGRVSIEIGDGSSPQHIEVHNHVYQLGENRNILQAASKIIRPIEEGKDFNRIEIRENDKKVGEINRQDAVDIQKSCDLAISKPEPSKPQTIEAVLQILAPVYTLDAQSWRFWYGEQAITADIADTDMAARAMTRGGVAVGDSYKVKLEITQYATPTKQIRNSYKIVEIQDFIAAQPTDSTQADLFTYLNRSE